MVLRNTAFPGVFTDSENLYTRNLTPSMKVYGERLICYGGHEYREWAIRRSKLAAYLKLGGSFFPFNDQSKVLYLGAASGTTASHISDIVTNGKVYCVEISPRSFRDLLLLCNKRKNMIPILADANKPEFYQMIVGDVDVVYQDVAQKDQVSIFLKNMRLFKAQSGLISVKSRSEDVTRKPNEIYEEVASRIRFDGMILIEMLPLDPFEKDHAMIAVRRK